MRWRSLLVSMALCVGCGEAVHQSASSTASPSAGPGSPPGNDATPAPLPDPPPPANPPPAVNQSPAAICPYPGPKTCSVTPPVERPVTCLQPIVPEVPVFPPPKGDVGPCEDLEYTAPDSVYGHEFISHVINSWDDRGHIVAQTSFAEDGTQTSTKTRRFDQCGHLIWEETSAASTVSRMENEYTSDGYLVRHAESAGSTCTVNSFAYTFDANGKVDAQLDGQSCGWTTRYSYDQGRLTGIAWQGAGAGYTYFPDGKMSSSHSSGMSISDSTRYDEAGAPVAFSFSSDTGAMSSTEWSYGPAHELLAVHETSSYCGSISTDRTFEYDGAGRVVHEDVTVTREPCINPGDPATTVVTTVDYDTPAPGLQIADTKDASGNSIKRVRTSFDARGNVTAVDQAMAPDFTWLPISRRNYDCWAH